MINNSRNLLDEVKKVISQLDKNDYSTLLPVLFNGSIGKHVRHILDLFECLIESSETGILNYDKRKRCQETEIDKDFALQKIDCIQEKIIDLDLEKKIRLQQNLNGQHVECETSIRRELLYNIEHTVHHLAIIRIGVEQDFGYVEIPENFGIAYSTLQKSEAEA